MQRWMPDGAHVIAAHADGRVTLLSTEADSEMVLHHSSFVYHAMFSPDGKYVVSGGWKGEVKLWDAGTGRLIATPSEGWLQGAGSPAIVGFARDTGELVVDAANGVFRWNLDALAHGNAAPAVSPPAPQFPETMAKLTSAARRTRVDGGQVTATSADGMLLADAEEGGIVRVLDAAGKTLRTLHPAEGQVRAVSFSPDGAVLAVGGDDRKIYLLGVASACGARRAHRPSGHNLHAGLQPRWNSARLRRQRQRHHHLGHGHGGADAGTARPHRVRACGELQPGRRETCLRLRRRDGPHLGPIRGEACASLRTGRRPRPGSPRSRNGKRTDATVGAECGSVEYGEVGDTGPELPRIPAGIVGVRPKAARIPARFAAIPPPNLPQRRPRRARSIPGWRRWSRRGPAAGKLPRAGILAMVAAAGK